MIMGTSTHTHAHNIHVRVATFDVHIGAGGRQGETQLTRVAAISPVAALLGVRAPQNGV